MVRLYPFHLVAYHEQVLVVRDHVSARDLRHAQRLAAYVVRTLVRDAVHPSAYDDAAVSWIVLPAVAAAPVDTSSNVPAPTVRS
jgi:hypothetical protein